MEVEAAAPLRLLVGFSRHGLRRPIAGLIEALVLLTGQRVPRSPRRMHRIMGRDSCSGEKVAGNRACRTPEFCLLKSIPGQQSPKPAYTKRWKNQNGLMAAPGHVSGGAIR